MLLTNWLFCMFLATAVFFNDSLTGSYIFDDDCNLELTKSAGIVYYAIPMALFVFIPMLVMPYFHVHIAYTVCQSQRRIKQIPERRNSSINIQVKLMLSVAYLAFQLCFLPYSVASLIDLFSNEPLPSEIWRSCTYIMYIHSMINFVIYGIFNTQFRAAYKILLGCKCCKCPCKEMNTVNIHINVQHVYNDKSKSTANAINK